MNRFQTFFGIACTWAMLCISGYVRSEGLTRIWDNVAIGGGGYITGMAIHPENPDILYARTDVGGAYRWDPEAERLIPLLDWVSFEDRNLYGVNGIALDPTDQDVVYVSLGKYVTRGPADVYKSTDRGETWTPMGLNKPFAGNNHPNRQGTTLVYEPSAQALFAGTPTEGLWIYRNGNWTQAGDIPGQAVRSIAIHPANPDHIYVASSHSVIWGTTYGDPADSGIYRSLDGGASFTRIPIAYGAVNQFTELSFSKEGDALYVSAYQNVSGSTGGVFRIDSPDTASVWVAISPIAGTYRAVTASPHDNDTVITSLGGYDNLNHVYFSTNRGATWIRKNNYTVHNIVPWHPVKYPGSAISCFIFDPVDPHKVYFSDWYSLYLTEDITAEPVHWHNEMSRGHEEIVPVVIVGAHPDNAAGAILYAGGADISGVCQTDLFAYTEIPNYATQIPALKEMSGVDYSEADGNVVVVMGGSGNNSGWDMNIGAVGVSTDGGATLTAAPGFDADWGGGRVAVSATDPDNFVVLGRYGGVFTTTDFGETFVRPVGVVADHDYGIGNIFNTRHPLVADRVNGHFYLYNQSSGDFLRSTDKGLSFQEVGQVAANSGAHLNVVSVPGHAGHLWLTQQSEYNWHATQGMYHSTDGGETWTRRNEFDRALLVTVGKAKKGAAYPTLYTMARKTTDSVYWFYASTDGGDTWQRVNDVPRAGNQPMCMGACPAVFGRFYVGTNGRGVYVAQFREGYEAWMADVKAPGTPAGLMDDPDGDGIPNLMEYALADGHPNQENQAQLPVWQQVYNEENQPTLTVQVPLRSGVRGLQYRVERSLDLGGWAYDPDRVLVISDAEDGQLILQHEPDALESKLFLRLNVVPESQGTE